MEWLFDHVSPDYRLYGVLRRYPVVLARLARQHLNACVRASREGYAGVRTELRDEVPAHGIEAVLEVYQREGSKLREAAHAAELIEQAMRGKTFVAKL